MASQKSRAVPPTRARGRARVEALLDAASAVFGERGYDHATMTEIAVRASTAIGSLYRFFPTKEALGETLLRHFAERSAAEFDALAGRAEALDAAMLAEALFAHAAHIRTDDRLAGALAVLEGRSDGPEFRRAYRAGLCRQISSILRKANPGLSKERAQDRATVLLYVVKGEHVLPREDPGAARRLTAEIRRLVNQYIADALCER